MNLFACLLAAAVPLSVPDLSSRFAAPPESCALQAWWHWCGDNVTERGIAADLEAMSELGVSTAHFFSPAMMGRIPGRHVGLLSPEWKRLFAFAVKEAGRRGIRLGFHNCPGWSSSGGPWIRPEDSMKVVVAKATDVPAGAARVSLPEPESRSGFYRDIAVYAFPVAEVPKLKRISGDFPADFSALMSGVGAVTLPLSEGTEHPVSLTLEYAEPFRPGTMVLRLTDSRAVIDGEAFTSADGHEWKRLRTFGFNYYADVGDAKYLSVGCQDPVRFFKVVFRPGNVPAWMGGKPFDSHLAEIGFTTLPMIPDLGRCNSSTSRFGYLPPADPQSKGVDRSAMTELKAVPAADGSIDLTSFWREDRKRGLWRFLRVGYTTSGKTCAPATLPGLECDKLSRRGLDAHWPHLPKTVLETPGAAGTIAVSIVDSYEVGGQNWTEELPREFKSRRGYELGPYLPAVVGYVVGDAGETAKFLFDFQQTVAELFAENYYDYFAERCRANGIEAALEAYGGPYDELRCFRNADVPTGEFWLGAAPHGSPRLAASAGHLNGRRRIAAESFTTEAMQGRWQITPHELRVSGDRGWLEGISQIVFHSYVSQPFENVRPGLSLGRHGTQLNRHTTWWTEGRGWADYVRRGQFLLQSGEPVAEAVVLSGVGNPNRHARPSRFVDSGYDFDFCGKDDLLRMEVRDGRIVVPGGPGYRLLGLGGDRHLTVQVLRKIKALLDSGAKVVGVRPLDTPSLADDKEEWLRLVGEIWNGERKNLLSSGELLDAVKPFGLRPSVESGGVLGSVRRRIAGRDFYFVMNDRDVPFAAAVSFAAKGVPTWWNAKDGSVTRLDGEADGTDRVKVRLELAPRESRFLGFVDAAEANGFPTAVPEAKSPAAELSEDWTITAFDGPAAPSAPVALAKLTDWSKSGNPALRYFSGRATYEKRIELPDAQAAFTLDLGEVRDVVKVFADGEHVATLWERPYRVRLPVTGKKKLTLRLEVINTWPNRMIGDAIARKYGAAEPKRDGYPVWVLEDRPDSGTGISTWSNFDYGWKADDEPIPSGLIGPVRLLR